MPEYSNSKVTIAFVLAGLLLFGASLNDPFHFDDALILKDSNVTNAARWSHFLNPFHLRQLTFFTFYLSYLAGGDDSFGFHVVSIALHVTNAILLYYLTSRFLERWVALIAAAVFLVHPIQTEAVLYVYQRSILLACFFSLLALISIYHERYWIAAILFVCAFESKESAISVPIALAILHRHKGRWPILIGTLVAGGSALALLVYLKDTTVGIGAAEQISPWTYFIAQSRVIYTYLRLLVWPPPQSLEYTYPAPPGIGLLIAQIGGLAAMVAAGLWMWRKDRWKDLGFCIIVFFILLAPTSSLIPSIDVAFEHRLYLPMLAFSVLIASIFKHLPRRNILVVPVLVLLSALTIQRGMVWGSDVSLWEDTVRKAPGKARAWFNLGGAHLKTNPERAAVAYEQAIKLEPNFPEAYYDLGIIEQGKGNLSNAIVYFQKAIEQDQMFWPAWNNMGNALYSLGQTERALDSFEKTLRLNKDYWPAQYNIGIIYFQTGRFEQAIRKMRITLDWSPDFKEARYVLATCLSRMGRQNDAESELKKVGQLAAKPGIISTPP